MENGLEQEGSVARVSRRLMERPGEKKIRPDRKQWQREGRVVPFYLAEYLVCGIYNKPSITIFQ